MINATYTVDVNSLFIITLCLSAELSIQPQLNSTLIPPHARAQAAASGHGETPLLSVFVNLIVNVISNIYEILFGVNW